MASRFERAIKAAHATYKDDCEAEFVEDPPKKAIHRALVSVQKAAAGLSEVLRAATPTDWDAEGAEQAEREWIDAGFKVEHLGTAPTAQPDSGLPQATKKRSMRLGAVDEVLRRVLLDSVNVKSCSDVVEAVAELERQAGAMATMYANSMRGKKGKKGDPLKSTRGNRKDRAVIDFVRALDQVYSDAGKRLTWPLLRAQLAVAGKRVGMERCKKILAAARAQGKKLGTSLPN